MFYTRGIDIETLMQSAHISNTELVTLKLNQDMIATAAHATGVSCLSYLDRFTRPRIVDKWLTLF